MKSKTIIMLLGVSLLATAVPADPAVQRLTERQKALHALNRLAFGPRPGEVDRVMAEGVQRWIARQLHPETISDAALDAELAAFPTLAMTDREIFDRFERPILEMRQEQRRRAQSPQSETSDVDLRRMRERIPPESRPQRLIIELSAAKIIRASLSERQLDEVMVDFWMNHFNVFAGKGLDRVLLTAYERDVIRPHVWGRFEDLLLATAKSPAMLFYLDNARSIADQDHRMVSRRRAGRFGSAGGGPRTAAEGVQRRGGLNENYARELMELHTLGVDGGYTQKDVTELARVLTGWSIARPGEGEGFLFRARLHDSGSKTVLGHRFPAGGGIEEGEEMLRILARHPATAHHISLELCRRLVADDPPPALVDRVAKRFLDTRGDLRETVRAVVTSSEFFDPKYYRAKVKTPFEYAVSAVRAVDTRPDGRILARKIAEMGQPLYLCQPPTGYSDRSDAWVSSGALIARLNFALALAAGAVPGCEPLSLPANADVGRIASMLVGDELSPSTRRTIDERLGDEKKAPAPEVSRLVAGLVLGSPEFQRR